MFLVAFLRHGLRLLVPLAIASTVWLYFFPVFLGCAFPGPDDSRVSSGQHNHASAAYLETARQHLPAIAAPLIRGSPRAPFRLLAIGDPQLEGDTSIPTAHGARLPNLKSLVSRITSKTHHNSFRERARESFHDLVDFWFEDIYNEVESIRKRIDLFGNDLYLAHIYRTVHWWSQPTHVTVLGDLVGSQWIGDDEFDRRAGRFWNKVFRNADRVPDELATYPEMEYDLAAYLDASDNTSTVWARRLINVAGNHDIGYAGDIDENLFNRFERAFGKANYELRFELPIHDPVVNATIFDEATNPESDRLPPELRIVVVNDMNLDTPAKSAELQDATYAFVNSVIKTSSAVEFLGHFTIVLTHIPLYKPEGVCVDAPFFDFHGDADGGGVKEQNLLSADASRGFLEGMFGMSGDTNAAGNGRGRRGVILNGHDHEGCDTFHYINQTRGESSADRSWEVQRWGQANDGRVVGAAGIPGLREITVRSIMGDFGGNTGLLSAWFDETSWEWKFEYATCALGRQHVWWLVHILDLVVLGAGIVFAVLVALGFDNRQAKATVKVESGGDAHTAAARKDLK